MDDEGRSKEDLHHLYQWIGSHEHHGFMEDLFVAFSQWKYEKVYAEVDD
jgi:hypothetical protein